MEFVLQFPFSCWDIFTEVHRILLQGFFCNYSFKIFRGKWPRLQICIREVLLLGGFSNSITLFTKSPLGRFIPTLYTDHRIWKIFFLCSRQSACYRKRARGYCTLRWKRWKGARGWGSSSSFYFVKECDAVAHYWIWGNALAVRSSET